MASAPTSYAQQSSAAASTAVATSDPRVDGAGPTQVTMQWKERLGGAAKKAGESLLAEITNNTDEPQQGRLVLAAVRLASRVANRPVGKFSVPARGRTTVTVPVSALPIQCEVALSYAVLQAEIDSPEGVLRLSSRLLHYIFSGGYTQAELYSDDEVRMLPNGGLRTSDPMDVRGKVLDASGTMQDIDDKANATPGRGRQGFSVRLTGIQPGRRSRARLGLDDRQGLLDLEGPVHRRKKR
jgi:hypothetical protein